MRTSSMFEAVTLHETRSRRLGLALVLVASTAGLLPAQLAEAGSFVPTSSLVTPRDGFTVTLLPSSKVLVAGGYDGSNQLSVSELYDPAAGVWAATGPMGSRRSVHTATLLPNGKVLVVGGYNGTNRVSSAELYDPATSTWTPTGSLNAARSVHTATLLQEGKVLVAGGANDSTQLDSAELYDPATGTWALTGSMTGSRATHTATLLPNGQVLIAGGEGSAAGWSAELYDPATRMWAATGDMSDSRFGHTATLLPNERVLVAGGQQYGGPIAGYLSIAGAELYDPASGTWAETGPLTDSRFGHSATLLPNGQVLVTGGRLQGAFAGGDLASAELYDPVAGTWGPAATMTVSRFYHSATLLSGGQVLIAAGFNYRDNDLSSAEFFDPSNGSWAATGWMTDARSSHTATLLTNGQVLVAGGIFYDGVSYARIAGAEVYDPASQTWAQTRPMNIARAGHAAVLLPTGKVLVVGGTDFPTNSELYDPILGSWSLVAGPPDAGVGHTMTLLRSGKVLVAGGWTNGTALSSARLFDPVAGTWTNTGAMTAARFRHTATLLPTGQVLVAGGLNNTPIGIFSSAELYDPVSGKWTATGSMSFPRKGHTATLLPNGTVLVVTTDFDGPGGSAARATGELYNPVSGLWTLTGSLAHGRGYSTATLLPSGQVLLAGGADYDALIDCSSSAELYDPAVGTWTLTAALNFGRRDDTATLLLSGKVLVAGGCSGLLQSAELYDAGLGFNSSWQAQIGSVTSPLSLAGTLVISGSGFRGVSEASGGNGCQNSGSDYPLVQLRSVANGETAFLLPTNWSATSFGSAPVSGFPPGFAMATVFVNGIPSVSSLLNIAGAPVPTPPLLTGPRKLPNGSFEFGFTNTPGALFGVLATTNPALPLASWITLGGVTEISPGHFQFTDSQATNYLRRYYRVRAP